VPLSEPTGERSLTLALHAKGEVTIVEVTVREVKGLEDLVIYGVF
jgi:hypothetical protein